MRSSTVTLQALASVSDLWLDSQQPFRKDAVAALQVSTGYSKALVERALEAVFQELTFENLNVYHDSLGRPEVSVQSLTVLHVAAGNVFTAWLHGAVISLILGHQVWLKPSSQESVFAALWKKSIALRAPAFAESIRIVAWDEKLRDNVDLVIAYGTDETLRVLKETFAPLLFVGYGHKTSIAIIFRSALGSAFYVDAAVRDIEAFDLQGCLSPQIIYSEGDATPLKEAVKKRLPHNPMPQWKSFETLDALGQEVSRFRNFLSCVGVLGSVNEQAAVQKQFGDNPSIRICRLGDMQQPPLTWRNGGINLGEFLLKCKG